MIVVVTNLTNSISGPLVVLAGVGLAIVMVALVGWRRRSRS